jgi:hypothetical protein
MSIAGPVYAFPRLNLSGSFIRIPLLVVMPKWDSLNSELLTCRKF